LAWALGESGFAVAEKIAAAQNERNNNRIVLDFDS
jgi:hypothetical protein